MKGIDGAGIEVKHERMLEAVQGFAELWGTGQFDCGPQDYRFMVHEINRIHIRVTGPDADGLMWMHLENSAGCASFSAAKESICGRVLKTMATHETPKT